MKNLVKRSLVVLAVASLPLMADMDRCVSCHGVDFEKTKFNRIDLIVNTSSITKILL